MTPQPKPPTRKRLNARKRRDEVTVIAEIRQAVFDREQDTCAVLSRLPMTEAMALREVFGPCGGVLNWAHLHGNRRSKNMRAPLREKHSTKATLAICVRHHLAEEHEGLRFVGSDPALGMDSPQITWLAQPPKTLIAGAK